MEKPTMLATNEILARYREACQFNKPVYTTAIKVALWRWSKFLTGSTKQVLFVNSASSLACAAFEAYARRDQTISRWKLETSFYHLHRTHIQHTRHAIGSETGRSIFVKSPARLARLAFDQWVSTTGWTNYGSTDLVDAWLASTSQIPAVSSFLTSDDQQVWAVWDVAKEVAASLSSREMISEGREVQSWLLDAFEAGAWLFLLAGDAVVVATRPDISCDSEGRLHNERGPAFKWNDVELWYWHGVNVTPDVVLHPEKIRIADIEYSTVNAEVRRVLIERYGEARFVAESGADCLDDDPRFGVLWYKRLLRDEPLVFLELTNATPEPTGEYKHFWLRVPPTMHTAREAAAWTFGMDTADYHPIFES